MVAKKTNDTDRKPQHSFCIGMEEMMKNWCVDNEDISACCSQFQEMCRPNTTGKSDFMSICETMRNMFGDQSKQPQDE